MSYIRVIPRDLFNEASLLKMLGQFWLLTDHREQVQFIHTDLSGIGGQGLPFMIEQDRGDGSISVSNVRLFIKNQRYRLYRPLNSREAWPLWIERVNDSEFEAFQVFDDLQAKPGEASLSDEMLQLIGVYDEIEEEG